MVRQRPPSLLTLIYEISDNVNIRFVTSLLSQFGWAYVGFWNIRRPKINTPVDLGLTIGKLYNFIDPLLTFLCIPLAAPKRLGCILDIKSPTDANIDQLRNGNGASSTILEDSPYPHQSSPNYIRNSAIELRENYAKFQIRRLPNSEAPISADYPNSEFSVWRYVSHNIGKGNRPDITKITQLKHVAQ